MRNKAMKVIEIRLELLNDMCRGDEKIFARNKAKMAELIWEALKADLEFLDKE